MENYSVQCLLKKVENLLVIITGFVRIRPNQAKLVFLEKVEKSQFLSVFLLKNCRILVFCLKILEYQFFSVQMLENSE